MERAKRILNILLFPPKVFCALFIPFAFGLLIYSFASGQAETLMAYVSYFLSAIALTLLCARTVGIVSFVRNLKRTNPFLVRYFSDAQYRMKLSLYCTLGINTLYALLQLISGIYHHTIWFYSLSVYYILLATMRFLLLQDTLKNELGKNLLIEFQRYRFCGILLMLLNLALAVIVFYIVRQNRGFKYNYILTIAMAAYSFFSITMAIVNVIKYRKHNSPVMSAAKAISLASAMVSILSLETAMISAFGEQNSPEFRRIMTAATGSAVCISVLIMAIVMIVQSTKEIKKSKGASYNGKQ